MKKKKIILPIAVLIILVGIVYMLVVYDGGVSDFFNSPLNMTVAIALMVVFSVLIVIISQTNDKGKAKGSIIIDENLSGAEEPYPDRFSKLSEVDEEMTRYKRPQYDDDITFAQLCDGFRDYAAYKHGLYYDITTVRSFIAGLAVNKLIIMQGISGTGKTSMAWVFGEYIGRPSSIIPVQPSWREKTDLIGYFNEFTHKYNETEFLRSLYEASYTDDMCVTVLDEMNIARVEYYFAEFLSLLELKQADSRIIDVVSSGAANDPKKIVKGRFKVPDNMWYIGTANNDDSTMTISDKVYDRAMVIDLNHRAEPFEGAENNGIRLSFSRFNELVKNAKERYTLSAVAGEKICELDKYMISHLGITFGNRIMRQLEEFVPVFLSCGGTENEAIDIIMARKVLRKLEAKNPLLVQRQTASFISFIENLFGDNEMVLCKEVLSKYDN